MGADPYDCLYEGMLPFHNHFRHTLSQIQTILPLLSPTAPTPAKSRVSALGQLLYASHSLCRSLEMHHTIEERMIFPKLAQKLPQFAHSSQHTKEHDLMHGAIEKLEAYVVQVSGDMRNGKVKAEELGEVFDYDRMKGLVDRLGEVLLPHLEAEEASLRAEVVKAAGFQLGEIRNLIR